MYNLKYKLITMSTFVESISRKLKDTEMERTVRLICCGIPFDFDLLRLNNMFPNNIIQQLSKHNENTEKDTDGATILRINTDVLSMRIIYSYYNTLDLLIPEQQIEREILLNTCDYFGFIEISRLLESILLKEESDHNVIVTDFRTSIECNTTTVNENIDDSVGSDEYIVLQEKRTQDDLKTYLRNTISYTINSKCTLSDLDKKILINETVLRKEYAAGNRPSIPRIKFIDADKQYQPIDHPYTLVNSPQINDFEWIEYDNEFLENLKYYSFGILDETMPSNLVVAGSSALKCAQRLNIAIPESIIKELIKFCPLYETIFDDYLIIIQMDNSMNLSNTYPPEKIKFLSKMITCHIKSFYKHLLHTINRHQLANCRQNRSNIMVYFENLQNKLKQDNKLYNISRDIDLFITTENPETILNSIRYIYNRYRNKFGNVHIIRTEHAVSFYTDNYLVPPIQIILRAYDSLEHVLLGFDIDSCCIGYDGEVICTERFLRAIRYRYNLVDVTRLSTSYEVRLVKYYGRGFSIAMTEPSIKERTENILGLIEKYGDLFYSILRGIYKLSYLLISYHKLAKISKIYACDYTYSNIENTTRMLSSGIEKTDFIYGHDLDSILFGGTSQILDLKIITPWKRIRRLRRIYSKISKKTKLPPIRIMRRNVTKQTDSDELFTGSFNPIQMQWYEGAIVI